MHKSKSGQWDLLNSDGNKNNTAKSFDIMLLQEPYIDYLGNLRATRAWRLVKPNIPPTEEKSHPRSIILVNAKIPTDSWEEIRLPNGNRDVTAIQLRGEFGRMTIFNIYNDQNNSKNFKIIDEYLTNYKETVPAEANDFTYVGGDFNRHHPMWESDDNTQLLTARHIEKAQQIINLMGKHDLQQTLPKGIPTYYSSVHKSWTRPDNVLCSTNMVPFVIICNVANENIIGPGIDHLPIQTTVTLKLDSVKFKPKPNFRKTDWRKFKSELKKKLTIANLPKEISTEEEFQKTVDNLTKVIQKTIEENVEMSKPTPLSKRWWNADLATMKKEVRKLGAEHYKYRALKDHPAHTDFKKASNRYSNAIKKQKVKHWEDYLTRALDEDTTSINFFITEPPMDGGNSRIPTLAYKNNEGIQKLAMSNEEKAKILSQSFFPKKPEGHRIQDNHKYPEPIRFKCRITEERVTKHVNRLGPYKAPGPDGIPNAVWIHCSNILTPILTKIFTASMKLRTYSPRWKEWTTVVLKKLGKPRYDTPKAWRPIALMNTMGKILTAIIAEDLSYICKKHKLLPTNHFGGRAGRTTTDAIHLLTHKIKAAIRKNKTVSVLFLNIEGAFPNAMPEQLYHNMRRRRIPEEYVLFTQRQLENRRTKLTFDDYTSEWININNGIGQGDPASMFDYLLYDADLIDTKLREKACALNTIPTPGSARERGTHKTEEDAAAYVDDTWLMGIGNTFEESHATLKDMMERKGGALEWSKTHNSKFELTKTVLMGFTNKRECSPTNNQKWIPLQRPTLEIDGTTLKPENSCRYLGIQIDQELKWNEQTKAAIGKATKWALAFKRMAQPSKGVKAKLMQKLYKTVLIPKLTYGLDTWYRPTSKPTQGKRRKGSVGALKQFIKIQRIAALAITGALRTTAMDALEIHAGIHPMEITLKRACQRAALRLATLPESHPLYKPIKQSAKKIVKRHPSPLHHTMSLCPHKTNSIEKITNLTRSPTYKAPATITISASREASKRINERDKAEVKIYTDGSGYEGGIGASAVMYKNNRKQKELIYHLGPSTTYTVANAEAVGSCLAAHLISNLAKGNYFPKEITINIDSQATIRSLGNTKAKVGQHIKEKFLDELEAVKKKRPNTKYKVHWITVHDGIEGNEKADGLAKEAAKGQSSPVNNLPEFLRKKPLPLSRSAIKQHLNKNLEKEWKESWDNSPRKRKLARADNKLPNQNFIKKTEDFPRWKVSLLTQLLTGHIPFNDYLHKISKNDSPRCPACKTTNETVQHVILDCPAYRRERFTLRLKTGRNSRNLQYLMNDKKGMKFLTMYIKQTGRLRRPNNEQDQEQDEEEEEEGDN